SAAEVLADARARRVAFYRVASAVAAGAAPEADHVAALNDRLGSLLSETRLHATPSGLVAIWGGASDDPARVLWPVARAAVDLLTGPEVGRLRECAGRDCHWLFLDRSKNGSRRWCAMANCGNAAKARRHRARSRRRRRQEPAGSGGRAA
ncbi:MAG: CGNR zinc finger domain-containing protein, partial [Kiloniellales bacterium]|nr:CGNR zinc finger domain-containing protein [Kiloniellales bacterium]